MKYQQVVYEPEDYVLNIWLSKNPIDYAEDKNGVIVHYTKDDQPVYIEILDATKFLERPKSRITSGVSTAIAHRIK